MIRTTLVALLAGLLGIGMLPADEPERKVERQVMIFASGGSWLGLNVGDVDADRAAELGLSEPGGAEIRSVVPDSPAAEAGLTKGEIVLQYQGNRIEGVRQLTRLVRETPSGRVVNLQIYSDGSTRMVQVKLTGRAGKFNMHHDGAHVFKFEGLEGLEGLHGLEGLEGLHALENLVIPDIEIQGIDIPRILAFGGLPSSARLGVVIEELSVQLGDFFGVEDGEGVLVQSVVKGSRAEGAGIKAGDVIIEIDDVAIADGSDLRLALRERRGETLEVTVVRDRRQKRLSVAAPKDAAMDEPAESEFIWHDGEGKTRRWVVEEARQALSAARRDLEGARRDQRLVFEDLRSAHREQIVVAREEIRRAVEEARRMRQERQGI